MKEEYPKVSLFKSPIIKGNLNSLGQQYEIFYYYKTPKLNDKIALYLYLIDPANPKRYAKRSIYFETPGDIELLSVMIHKAYKYILEQTLQEYPKWTKKRRLFLY